MRTCTTGAEGIDGVLAVKSGVLGGVFCGAQLTIEAAERLPRRTDRAGC
jgi:hypothetical protein